MNRIQSCDWLPEGGKMELFCPLGITRSSLIHGQCKPFLLFCKEKHPKTFCTIFRKGKKREMILAQYNFSFCFASLDVPLNLWFNLYWFYWIYQIPNVVIHRWVNCTVKFRKMLYSRSLHKLTLSICRLACCKQQQLLILSPGIIIYTPNISAHVSIYFQTIIVLLRNY